MYRRAAACVLVAGLCVYGIGSLAAAGKDSDSPPIAGVARAADQRPLIDYLVRLRSLDTARVVATTRTSTTGEYAFRGVSSGRYGVEILDSTDRIVGTAGPFIVSATTGRSHAAAITVVGATAAAIASVFTNTSPSGSAREVAAAADSAGITGNGVSSIRVVPSRPH
jgi:hypothetical protein